MDHYGIIRRKVRDGMSQRAVAKAMEFPIPPGYRLSQPREKNVIAPFAHIIDAWIEADKKVRRKQRMYATKTYERLCDEYGFTGHYSTVQRYIKEATNRRKEVFMPLEFELGEEAQVDWHEAIVYENGIEKKIYGFCMKMCCSKAPFVCAYESIVD